MFNFENENLNQYIVGVDWAKDDFNKDEEYTLDEYLDAYNTYDFLYKTFGDLKHKEEADKIMNKLKQGEYK